MRVDFLFFDKDSASRAKNKISSLIFYSKAPPMFAFPKQI